MRSKFMGAVALSSLLLISGTSGCKLYRTSEQPDQAGEVERLRAENARLNAELANRQSKGPSSTTQNPGSTTMSEGAKKRLADQGVSVTKDGDRIRMTLPNTILFSSGSAALRADSRKALDEAAKVIKHEFANSELHIQGHTDNQPILHSANKFKSNHDLSVARAKAVAAALQKEGVKNRLKVEGLGETKPLNDNRTAEDRAENRRVEILIGTPGAKAAGGSGASMEVDDGS